MKKKKSVQLKGAAFIGVLFFAAALFSNINAVAQSDTATVTIQQILDAHNAYRNEVGFQRLHGRMTLHNLHKAGPMNWLITGAAFCNTGPMIIAIHGIKNMVKTFMLRVAPTGARLF